MKRNSFSAFLPIFILSFTQTFSARILGIVPTPFYSHQLAFQPLWKELSLRGHQVTVITTNPMKNPALKNLTEIDLSSMYDHVMEDLNGNEMASLNAFTMLEKLNQVGYKLIDTELQYPEVQKLIKDKNQHFDVVLAEALFFGMAAFAERFKCPLIQMFSFDALTVNHYSIGNPAHPVLNPDPTIPFMGKLNFFERLTSSVFVFLATLNIKYRNIPLQDSVIKRHFGNGLPSLEKTLSKTSLMFVNTDFAFHPIRPLMPNVIQIGGGTHLTKPKPLPKNLQNILDNAKNGVIYFSLGSNVRSSLLSEDIQKTFIETFAELPYTILWKFEGDLPGKPKNVFISKWLPQQDILRHPNVKAFISHGGLQSMDEAAHNHIPIIGIPFFGDQQNNVRRIVYNGMGLELDLKTLDQSTLKNAILEIMNNPKYRNRVKQLAKLSKDQPMTGLERAVWWTEYVIRHKGAEHLRSPALDLPTYQYFLLDVIGFCLLVALIVTYILVKLVQLVFKLVRYLLPKTKLKLL